MRSRDQDEGFSALHAHRFRLDPSANTAREKSMEKAKELIAAIRSEDLEKAKRIIETGMKVNAISETTGFALYWAVVRGKEYTKLLLDSGAVVDLGYLEYPTPLGGAVLHGDLETVKLLLEHGADVNAPGNNGKMPLEELRPYRKDFASKMQLLRDNGASTSQRDIDWNRVLVNSRGQYRVKRAIDKGADINTVWGGRTALIGCIESFDFERVERLLQAGAEPNLVVYGTDALMVAVRLKYMEIVRLLLENGASPNTNHQDGPPFLAAVSSGDISIALLLLQHGADRKIARECWDSKLGADFNYFDVDELAELRASNQKAVGCIRSKWEIPDVLNPTTTSPPGHDSRSEFAQSSLSHHVVLIGADITGDRDGDGDPLGLAIEATTCGEYVYRTWGELGSQLLADINDGLNGKVSASKSPLISLYFSLIQLSS